jgi:spoIIIJ-associated protein
MTETGQAAQTIAAFLQSFTNTCGMRLRYRIKVRTPRPTITASQSGLPAQPSHEPIEWPRDLHVEFEGPDTPLLLARNAELLNSLEHIAAKMLHLEPEDHDRVSFDADHYKADRDRQLRESAAAAIARVQACGRPYAFPAMSSRERRMLHLVLNQAGMPTASSGEGPARFVVLYPYGADTSAPFVPPQPPRRVDSGPALKAFRAR